MFPSLAVEGEYEGGGGGGGREGETERRQIAVRPPQCTDLAFRSVPSSSKPDFLKIALGIVV